MQQHDHHVRTVVANRPVSARPRNLRGVSAEECTSGRSRVDFLWAPQIVSLDRPGQDVGYRCRITPAEIGWTFAEHLCRGRAEVAGRMSVSCPRNMVGG